MRAHAYAQRNIVMEHNLLAFQWSSVLSVLLAILILLAMITIHEFGHYLAGKIFHFKINEFSIGFGPALFKRKRKNSDELFSVRLIPLGGYCAFDGEDGLEEESSAKPPKEPFEETGSRIACRGEKRRTGNGCASRRLYQKTALAAHHRADRRCVHELCFGVISHFNLYVFIRADDGCRCGA